jgi:hypothetical protein
MHNEMHSLKRRELSGGRDWKFNYYEISNIKQAPFSPGWLKM